MGPPSRLLVPMRTSVAADVADRLEGKADALRELGVDLERFGPREMAIRALPAALNGVPGADLLARLDHAATRGSALGAAMAQAAATVARVPEEAHAQRTLLAVLDEAGVPMTPPVVRQWPLRLLLRSAGR